jgi:uncharacterized protein YuzE
MKVDYDSRVDAAYIYFDPSSAATSAHTYACDPDEVGGQIQLDFDDSGRLIGIEVLDASHKLPASLLKAKSSSR